MKPKTSWAKCRNYEEQLHCFRVLKELGVPIYEKSWTRVNEGFNPYFEHICFSNGKVERCNDSYRNDMPELPLPDFMAQFQKYKDLPLIGYQAKPEERKRIKKRLKELGLFGRGLEKSGLFETCPCDMESIEEYPGPTNSRYTYATSAEQFIHWIENLAMGRAYDWHGFQTAPQVQAALDEIEALKAENAKLKERLAELESKMESKPVRTVKDALMEIPEPFRTKAIANTSAENLAKAFDRKASDALSAMDNSFSWAKSDQGYVYWCDVRTFLENQGL